MRKFLTGLITKLFKEEVELLYGSGSYIVVNNVRYITNGHYYSIDVTLHIKDIELFEQIQNEGVNYVIGESWSYTGLLGEKFMVVNSYELI